MQMPRYAAIDIGSNSIRMEAAEAIPGQPTRILASDREVTRLGEGVFRDGMVSEDAIRLTCTVLARMAALYRKLDVVGVRAVATSAIRDTRNPGEFLARASRAAGAEVEIISGREEARLIHMGVQSVWPHPNKRILVIDIGGGSAEIVAAENGRMMDAYSRPLGAVRLRAMFLEHDPPTSQELHRMHEFIEEKIAPAVAKLAHDKWDRVIGTSASAAAVASAIARLPRARREDVDRLRVPAPQVHRLYQKLSQLNVAARRKVTGIGPRRAEIIIPGVAVLDRFLQSFRLPSVYYSRAGVRDGIIADLAARGVGREVSQLSRDQRREVEQVSRRFGVAQDHASKVAAIGRQLFGALQPLHQLPPNYGRLLEAAAYLLDVGHYISASSHHKHSWYVVANSDLPGFTERERLFIAGLCRYHRKSMPNAMHSTCQALAPEERRALYLMIPILRLADNLDRSPDQHIQRVECSVSDGNVLLQVHANGDIDLEQWAAERVSEIFQQVYERPVSVVMARS